MGVGRVAGSQGTHFLAAVSDFWKGKSQFPLGVWPLVSAPAKVDDSTPTHIQVALI